MLSRFRKATEGDHSFSLGARWLIVGRIFMALGSLVPGVLLIADPHHWSVTQILNYSLNMSSFVVCILAGILILGGIGSFFAEWRDVAYILAAVGYAVVGVAYFIALLTGLNVGAFFISSLVLAWVYVERSLININLQADKNINPEDTE